MRLPWKITQSEIFQKLRQHKAYIKKGMIIFYDGRTFSLKPYMAAAIDRNNRIAWVESFKPASKDEVDFLCKIGKVDRTELVSIAPDKSTNWQNLVNDIRTIFNDPDTVYIKPATKAAGYKVLKDEDNYFAVDFSKRIIVNLGEEGFNLRRLEWQHTINKQKNNQSKSQKHSGNPVKKFRDLATGRGDNREWEVGYRGRRYDEIDDENTLKR